MYIEICRASDKDWLEIRRTAGVGASESATLLGHNPFSSPLALYTSKLGLSEPSEQSEAMMWGHILEPVICEQFAKETGRDVIEWQVTLQSQEWPFLTCTPDAYYENNNTRIPVQVKVTSRGDRWKDDVPVGVWIQVQHEMAVIGAPSATVVVLVGGTKLLWKDITRDDDFINKTLVPVCRKFWNVVINKEPYSSLSIDAKYNLESTKRALEALHPDDNGETIQLEGRFAALVDERLSLLADAKEKTKTALAIENMIRSELGDNTYGVLPNGVVVSLKTIQVDEKQITRKAYKFRKMHFSKAKG